MLASPTVIAKRTECVPCVTVSFSKSSEVHLELLQVFDYFSLSKQSKLFHGSPVAPAASVSNLVSFDAASFRCYASARLFRTSQPTTRVIENGFGHSCSQQLFRRNGCSATVFA